jgi:hypothetical protein
MRDIEADYRAAYIAEYESYRRAGRDADAENVATILREQYGHDVEAEPEQAPAAPEHAAADRPPEAAVEPKPARAAAKRTPAKKAVASDSGPTDGL